MTSETSWEVRPIWERVPPTFWQWMMGATAEWVVRYETHFKIVVTRDAAITTKESSDEKR